MQTIYILWLRELTRYSRSRARIIGSLGQPLLFLLALGFGLGPVFQKAGQGSYFQFLGPGVIAMSILFTAIFAGIQIIWDKQFGFLKETLVAPVSRLSIMLGKTLGGATIATLQGIIVFVLTLFVGFHPNIAAIPLAIIFMLLISIFFTAVGISIASLLEDMQGFQLIMNFLVQPLFFLSGALFPINNLPKVFEMVVGLDPLSYGVDGIRGSLTGLTHYGLGIDFLVLFIMTSFILVLGSYLFSKIQL
ncbi:MAG TPA: ABC transporter permease [Patescibacteria group bacterium]